MAKEDDDKRLRRSLNSLERRNRLARRKGGKGGDDATEPVAEPDAELDDDLAEDGEEAREAQETSPFTMGGPVTDPGGGGPSARNREGDEEARPTTDGLPPRAPGRMRPPGVHTDHFAATLAALRQLAASRPGFDVMVVDPRSEPLTGSRITAVAGGTPRVVSVVIEVDGEGAARPVSFEASAAELEAAFRRRDK